MLGELEKMGFDIETVLLRKSAEGDARYLEFALSTGADRKRVYVRYEHYNGMGPKDQHFKPKMA